MAVTVGVLQIDWAANKILGWSEYCYSTCLNSVIPPVWAPELDPSKRTSDLTTVPPEYHDLAEAFSKEEAHLLPPHCPYDDAVGLLPGASLPSSRDFSTCRDLKEKPWRPISKTLQQQVLPDHRHLRQKQVLFWLLRKTRRYDHDHDYSESNRITVKNKYRILCLQSLLLLSRYRGPPSSLSWTCKTPTSSQHQRGGRVQHLTSHSDILNIWWCHWCAQRFLKSFPFCLLSSKVRKNIALMSVGPTGTLGELAFC